MILNVIVNAKPQRISKKFKRKQGDQDKRCFYGNVDLQFAFEFSPPKWVGCQGSKLRAVSGAHCRSSLLTGALLSHTLRAILSWRPPVYAPSSRGLAVLYRVGARAPTSVAPSCRRPDGLGASLGASVAEGGEVDGHELSGSDLRQPLPMQFFLTSAQVMSVNWFTPAVQVRFWLLISSTRRRFSL